MTTQGLNDYVVGQDGCTINDILQLIFNSEISLKHSDLVNLRTQFNTQDLTVKSYVENWSSERTLWLEPLEKMLQEWRLRMSSGALLSTFIKYLRKCKLKALADIIQDEFWPGSVSKHRIQALQSSHQSNTTVKVITLFCLLMMLVAMVFIIIFMAGLTSPNKQNSFRIPERNDTKSNEIMLKKQNDSFNEMKKEFNESTLPPDNVDMPSAKGTTSFQARHGASLVVNYSEKLSKLLNLISSHLNLVKLEFNNTLGQLCKETNHEAFSSMIILSKLQEIVLDVSKNCENLLDSILSYIDMTNLKFFRFKGYITNTFVQQIHEFLHRYYRTLEEVHISGRLESTINMFEIRNTIVLNSVKVVSVKLEDVYDTTVRPKIINDRFCSIFPEIAKFETTNILISLDELFRLQNCSNLDNLNTKIRINVKDVRILKELNWHENFQSLRHIEVNFKFDVCPEPTFFDKLIRKFDMFDKYSLCSNCNMSSTWRTIHCIKKSKPT